MPPIAKALAAEGASVVVNYVSSKTGAEFIVSDITKSGGKAVAVGGDVSKAAEAQGIIDAAIGNYGKLDILVNNYGIYEFAPVDAITEEHFHKQFNINVLGLLLVTQASVKHMGDGGSIINMSSAGSRFTPPATAVYTATKSAIDGITGVFAKEFGSRKIRVNALAPVSLQPKVRRVTSEQTSKRGWSQRPLLDALGSRATSLLLPYSWHRMIFGWLTGERLISSGGLR